MNPTLPHPRTSTEAATAPRVAPDAPWMPAVIAAGGAGSAALLTAAAWVTVNHPTWTVAALAANAAVALTVATVRQIREDRAAPRGLGSWRVACGATPLDLP